MSQNIKLKNANAKYADGPLCITKTCSSVPDHTHGHKREQE